MNNYDNTNKGVAFFNDKKEKETQPDYRGKGNFKGTDFEFGMWARESKDGKEYFSISFSEPYKKTEKVDIAPTEVSDEPIDYSKITF